MILVASLCYNGVNKIHATIAMHHGATSNETSRNEIFEISAGYGLAEDFVNAIISGYFVW